MERQPVSVRDAAEAAGEEEEEGAGKRSDCFIFLEKKRPLKRGNIFLCGLHTQYPVSFVVGCLIKKNETLKEKKKEREEREMCNWRVLEWRCRDRDMGREGDSSPHPWLGINILFRPVSCGRKRNLRVELRIWSSLTPAGDPPRDQAGDHASGALRAHHTALHTLQIPRTV